MESNWAAEHLQTIRTLMERSAIYRRALAPVTMFIGTTGIAAAVAGYLLKIESVQKFAIYWMVVSLGVIVGAFLLVRRQALKNAEPFWSPPTRRVAQAMIPALSLGLAAGLLFMSNSDHTGSRAGLSVIVVWTLLYGLALNAAGFFMPRGIRLFGWGFLVAGVGIIWLAARDSSRFTELGCQHVMMGVLFGASHLAYGVYLYFTEPRKNEA
jgi:hypothetical protein